MEQPHFHHLNSFHVKNVLPLHICFSLLGCPIQEIKTPKSNINIEISFFMYIPTHYFSKSSFPHPFSLSLSLPPSPPYLTTITACSYFFLHPFDNRTVLNLQYCSYLPELMNSNCNTVLAAPSDVNFSR